MPARSLIAYSSGNTPPAVFTLAQDDNEVNILLNGKIIAYFSADSNGRIKFHSMEGLSSGEFVTDDGQLVVH